MGRYIKKFQSVFERNAYIQSYDFTKPFVSLHGGKVVSYNQQADSILSGITKIGQVCYFNLSENKLKFCDLIDYTTTMGPAQGVVAVPNNCAPDGNTRILALSGVTASGTPGSNTAMV